MPQLRRAGLPRFQTWGRSRLPVMRRKAPGTGMNLTFADIMLLIIAVCSVALVVKAY